MHQIFRRNTPFTVLFLVIICFVTKLQALMHPIMPVAAKDHVFYNFLLSCFNRMLHGSAFGYTLLAVLMIFAQALYLNNIAVRHKLFARISFFPAFCYVLFSSVHPSLNYFSEAVLVNWFLLGGLDMMLGFHQSPHPRKLIFNAGFMLAIAGLIQYAALGFLVLLYIALMLMRAAHPGEWTVAFMGFLIPIYFFACIVFLSDQLDAFRHVPEIDIASFRSLKHPELITAIVIGGVLFFVMGIYCMQMQSAKLTIYTRRSWTLIVFTLLTTMAVTCISVNHLSNNWLVLLPAFSLIAANMFQLEKSPRFTNFTFYFSILFIILCQFLTR